MGGLPRRQRVAAYAVVLRVDGQAPAGPAGTWILLSRLAERITPDELWTLPGGGLDHGEDPRDAVRREIVEETGLDAEVGDRARVYSAHLPHAWRDGRRVDAHALRIVYEGWVAPDAPEPRVVEQDGSTMAAAWVRVSDVLDGTVPVVPMVLDALADHAAPTRRQRVAAYALVVRDGAVLLTRNSVRGPHPGQWVLPGGGVDHGEDPRDAVVREVAEETGLDLEVGALLDVDSVHFDGTAPSGRREDFHAVQLVFSGTVTGAAGAGEPRPVEVDGTTDAAAWVPLGEVGGPSYPVRPLVRTALARA